MTRIEQLLRGRIGLDSATIGASSIQRIVRLRMKALGVGDVRAYEGLLNQSGAEWTELLETIVVKETWFFRDGEPFDTFVRLLRECRSASLTKRPVRVLSIPCSTGEEPYSLVIALLEAGVRPETFQVDAADISTRALVKARRAIYGRNSFRGKDISFRDRYFHHTKEGYVLCPAVRSAVRFFEGNILDSNFLPGKETYDIIFCRNLLIYFDRQTQARALKQASRLLSSSGFLIVGAAEQPLAFENGFVSANIPMAFACRKQPAASPINGSTRSHPARLLKLPPVAEPRDRQLPASDPSPPQRPAPSSPGPSPNTLGAGVFGDNPQKSAPGMEVKKAPALLPDLTEARRLADAGKLKEAASLCEAHLRTDASSAQAWYLLGLVSDALSDPLAVECYRKALYLNPNHYETLLQMALLAEKCGDLARARTFRQRAARLKPKADPTERASA
jgi:chemotaxis protein methyltransferase WspC